MGSTTHHYQHLVSFTVVFDRANRHTSPSIDGSSLSVLLIDHHTTIIGVGAPSDCPSVFTADQGQSNPENLNGMMDTSSRAELFQNAQSILDGQYDFVIIGGGTAGSVLANRLTENPDFQVLVLEAGPSNKDVLVSQIPFMCADLVNPSPYDWNDTTTPQIGLNNQSVPYPRGHILGGSSSINWLIYTRGSSEDFDRYAQVSGDDGWSWNSALSYFKKSEKWTTPADNHNTTGQYTPDVHGFNGEVSVSLAGFPVPINDRVMSAIGELGGDFKFNEDTNSGQPLGMGWIQSTIKDNERSSAATAYLTPEVLQRKNLHVVVNTRVSRVLQTSGGTVPTFRGVEFRSSSGGSLKTLTARKEVIISAGTIGSPQILLNSGIGDPKALSALQIEPLVDLPDVGENLVDHPIIGNGWLVNSTDTFETLRRDPSMEASALQQWKLNKTGPYVDTVVDHIGFARVDAQFLPDGDTAAGPNSPHYETLIANGVSVGATPPQGNFVAGAIVLLSPTSRGSVKLRSNDPFDSPLIDPALLKTDTDKVIMREGVKNLIRFFAASAWDGYVLEPAGGLANVTDDQSMVEYIMANSGSLYHQVGTSSMSSRNSTTGVVDPDLKVKKVKGLRVVDVSILPFVPSAHTQGPAYVIGERASDLIKADYA